VYDRFVDPGLVFAPTDRHSCHPKAGRARPGGACRRAACGGAACSGGRRREGSNVWNLDGADFDRVFELFRTQRGDGDGGESFSTCNSHPATNAWGRLLQVLGSIILGPLMTAGPGRLLSCAR